MSLPRHLVVMTMIIGGCFGHANQAWKERNLNKLYGWNEAVRLTFFNIANDFTTTNGPLTPPVPGAGSTSAPCVDKLNNCASYSDSSCRAPYEQWALDNCPKRCNLCAQITAGGAGAGGGFTNSNPGSFTFDPNTVTGTSGYGCFYGGRLYNQGDFWQDGCQYNCTCEDATRGFYKCIERCPTYTGSLPQGCSLATQVGKCCPEPRCVAPDGSVTWGLQKGCVYKNVLYQQGQKWDDGCTYSCTCIDGTTGQYSCTNKCYTWNLPPQCTMDPPGPGLCCPTPNCPSNVNLVTPPGYVPQ